MSWTNWGFGVGAVMYTLIGGYLAILIFEPPKPSRIGKSLIFLTGAILGVLLAVMVITD